MYSKRAYIVPTLNLKDGILIRIHAGIEGIDNMGALDSALELYEVTSLDGGNFVATKVTSNTPAANIIRGAFFNNSLRILEPLNLTLCPPAHIGSRVPASESTFEDTMFRVKPGDRDLHTAPIEYIYSDGVACSLDRKEDFGFTKLARKMVIDFYMYSYNDFGTETELVPNGYMLAHHVRKPIMAIDKWHGDFIMQLTQEATLALISLTESKEYKQSLDIVGKHLKDKYGAESDKYRAYFKADKYFLHNIRPTLGDKPVYPTKAENHELTIRHLEGKLQLLEAEVPSSLSGDNLQSLEAAKKLLKEQLSVLREATRSTSSTSE